MKELSNKVVLFFIIEGFEDCTHTDISNLLGVESSIKKERGEMYPPCKKSFHTNQWILGDRDGKSDFNTQLNDIISKLSSKKSEIGDLKEKYKMKFSCALYLFNKNESTPIVYFDENFYHFNKDLNIFFEFDIF